MAKIKPEKNDICILNNGDIGYYDGTEVTTRTGITYTLGEVSFILRYSDSVALVHEIENTTEGVVFPVQELGSKGLVTCLIQQALHCRGYKCKIDGVFGVDTHQALHDFMRDHYLSGDTVATAEVYKLLFADD